MAIVQESYAGQPLKIWKNGNPQQHLGKGFNQPPIWTRLLYVFLPVGYPASVKPDYLWYQIFDSFQALFSTLTGILATKELLKGLGVGNEDASASEATLTYLLKDGVSMITRILFAYHFAPKFMANVKSWRFAADVLNDLSYFLEFLAVAVPKEYFICVAALSGSLKCCVGVCGGASRMSLTMHFAENHNESDLDAKDGSQETLVNLSGMVCGWFMMKSLESIDDTTMIVWILFFVFTFFHLLFNYLAVSAVELDCLNEQRCLILLKSYLQDGTLLTPKQVAKKEAILRPIFTRKLVRIGGPLTKEIVECLKEDEIIHIRVAEKAPVQIFLHQDADNESILLAYLAAVCYVLSGGQSKVVQQSQTRLESDVVLSKLKDLGWQLHTDALGIDPYRFSMKL